MRFFKPSPGIDYIPAKLSQGVEWYIYFYVLNPVSGQMKRIRMKINRIKSKRERLKLGRQMMAAINERLALGWNPLREKAVPLSGSDIFEVFDAFLKNKAKTAEANSLRAYKSFIATMRSWLTAQGIRPGQMSAAAFTPALAKDIMNDIDTNEDISAQTYNNYLRFFTLLFNWMKEKGYTQDNPFRSIKRKSKRLIKKKRRVLTDEEVSRLVEFLKKNNPNYLAACMMCYCCFMRPKEIALLKCGDIHLDKQSIHVRSEIAKNDNDSFRTIPDEVMPIFRALDLSDPSAYVFTFDKEFQFKPGKKMMKSQYISRYWGDVVRRTCDFPMEIQFYSLKDSGITNMLATGVPVSIVKQQADHSSLAMTSVYLGKTPGISKEIKGVRIIK